VVREHKVRAAIDFKQQNSNEIAVKVKKQRSRSKTPTFIRLIGPKYITV